MGEPMAPGIGNDAKDEHDTLGNYYNVFKRIVYEKSITSGRTQILRPVSEISNSRGPYKFNLPALSNSYVALIHTRCVHVNLPI